MRIVENKQHDRLYRIAMFVFIVSLGLGDKIAVFGIRVTYIATAIIVLISLSRERISLSGLRNYKYAKFIRFGLIWMIYPVVTLIFVKDLSVWISQYVVLIINFIVVWLIVRYIKTERDWLLVGKSIIALLIITLAVGFWEIKTSNHIQVLNTDNVDPISVMRRATMPFTFYGNINDSASAMFLLFFMVLIYMLYARRWKKHRLVYIGLFLLSLYEIMATQARAVMYSFGVLLLFFVFYEMLARIKRLQAKNLYYIMWVCVVAGVLFLFAIHPPSYYVGLLSGNASYVASGDYASDLWRLTILKDSFVAFLKTLCIGLGPGQTILISGINLHNFYLEVLFEYGIFIGGYFLYSLFKLSFFGYKIEPRALDSVIKSTPFVLLLLGISSSHFFSIRITWVCIAFLFCLKYGDFRDVKQLSPNYYVSNHQYNGVLGYEIRNT